MSCLPLSRLITFFIAIFPLYAFPLSSEENFLLVNGITDELIAEQGVHINERVTPACSFNIALSLMGYDAKVLNDEKTPVLNFQEGYNDYLASWKAPQTPQSWMQHSCVWYSQLLASQIGLEKIQNYLASFDYGNQDISGGLTKAWLSSSLKISPSEQVKFVQKMVLGKFPISSYALQMTKKLLFKEELQEGWKLFGKTGMGSSKSEGTELKERWFVGWIEKDKAFFPFAYKSREKEVDSTLTLPRVKQLLIDSKIMNDL